MKLTPHSARIYILLAAFFLALPSLNHLYKGQEGRFLVAHPDQPAGVFQQSVIYIVHHDLFGGARGYIINRPLSGQDAFYGGPLSYPEHTFVMSHQGRERKYRGFAGWAPLQLEYEIIRGAWSIRDGDHAVIFSDVPEKIWTNISGQTRGAVY